MYPILFDFGIFKIYSYGFFVAIAFIVSFLYLLYSIRKSKEKIISENDLSSLSIYIAIVSIIGARLFFVFIDNLNSIITLSPSMIIFKLWHGGLVYYGAFISATFFILIYIKIKKISLFKLSDLFAPALALGHAIGRIGCFFAGCCYGKKVDNIPSLLSTFINNISLKTNGALLHPTQLYEAFTNFLLFLFLHFYSKRKHKSGVLFAFYLIYYAFVRFNIEFLRGDYRGVKYYNFSISQIISIFLFIVGILITLCKRK
ncbi:MAG: prolipoprotein diacylglyceryl transferase [Endomicrobium sp.]|jgi:phosphatidylglycerol:prolipoprotein diacylglycerol transferase|nr:prolipoprotein diacylglyceryl transferase [Endomicrobium sp.]